MEVPIGPEAVDRPAGGGLDARKERPRAAVKTRREEAVRGGEHARRGGERLATSVLFHLQELRAARVDLRGRGGTKEMMHATKEMMQPCLIHLYVISLYIDGPVACHLCGCAGSLSGTERGGTQENRGKGVLKGEMAKLLS